MSTLTRVQFAAMGNTVDLRLLGDDALVEVARRRVSELERRWSRFVAGSDVDRLNRSVGRETPVHPDTVLLVRYLATAQRLTAGAFDPTLTPALNALGYDRSRVEPSMVSDIAPSASAGCDLAVTEIDDSLSAVRLPHGATIDPGGLGKGLAADLVARELTERGAQGVCIGIGGDIRCAGVGPDAGGWRIAVADPFAPDRVLTMIRIGDAGVATSSTLAKRWTTSNGELHHLLDPATKRPLDERRTAPVQATVIAAEAVWAEVYATAVLVGRSVDAARAHDGRPLAALAIDGEGRIATNAEWAGFVDE